MNLHRLDLVSLSLFVAVARSGSISRGAQLVHLAVGAASKRIAALEEAAGAQLLARHSRGIKLSPAGEALLRHAERILGDVGQLAADLGDYAAGVTGVVRVWANTSCVTQFLPRELASFAASNPSIRIALTEHTSSETVKAVVDGLADFGLFAERTPLLGLQTLPYHADRLVLVVPRGHVLARRRAMAFAEALEFDVVSLAEDTSLWRRIMEATEGLGTRLKLRVRVRSFDAMCQMVACGLGVAVLPEAAARPHVQSMGLVKIDLRDTWSLRHLLVGARDFSALAGPSRLLLDHLLGAGEGGESP